MMRIMKTNLLLALMLSGTSVAAQAQEVLKFGVWTPEKELTYQTLMKPFAEEVTAASGGTLRIDTYPNGTLGRNPAGQIKLMQDGVADIIWTIPAYQPDRFPDNDVFELPGIVQNGKEGSYAVWRLYERGLLRGYDKYFVVSLLQAEPAAIHARKPITKLSDLRQVKIRTTGRVQTDAARALGAVPVSMSIIEVAEALSRGVIVGAVTQPLAARDFGIARVARNHFIVPFGSTTLTILMNKKKFDALPEKAQKAILKHRGMPLSTKWGRIQGDATDKVISGWKKSGKNKAVIATDGQKEQFRKLTSSVIKNYEKNHHNGPRLVKSLRDELAAFRKNQK